MVVRLTKGRYQEKDDREYLADVADTVRIVSVVRILRQIVAVTHNPFRFLEFFYLLAGIRKLLFASANSVSAFLLGVGIFLFAVGKLCFAVGKLLFRVGKLLLVLCDLGFPVYQFLLACCNLCFPICQFLFPCRDLFQAALISAALASISACPAYSVFFARQAVPVRRLTAPHSCSKLFLHRFQLCRLLFQLRPSLIDLLLGLWEQPPPVQECSAPACLTQQQDLRRSGQCFPCWLLAAASCAFVSSSMAAWFSTSA